MISFYIGCHLWMIISIYVWMTHITCWYILVSFQILLTRIFIVNAELPWILNILHYDPQVFTTGRNTVNVKTSQHTGKLIHHPSSQSCVNGPHSDFLLNNGVTFEEARTPTTSQSNNHIAFHLVSKVLEDESIFNSNSIEETTSGLEPFSRHTLVLSNG